MVKKLQVIQVSESEFSVKGHGVHTAYLETLRGLEASGELDVLSNSFRRADVRHIHTAGIYSLLQLLVPGGIKVISAHVVPASFVGSLVGAKRWLGLATWYLQWFYNRADLVIAVSDETKTELEVIGVTKPIEVIYNMIDTSRYQTKGVDKLALRRQYDIDEKATVVIGNGQVQPRKRVDTFVNLAHKFPDVEFVWVGGMPFKKLAADHARMQQMIDAAPANVRFSGVVSLDEVRDYLALGDVFIMTSEQETFGLAIVEAAASGLPIVLRDLRDYDNTFRPYALLCSEDEFSGGLDSVMSQPKLRHSLIEKSAELAKRFDSGTITDQIITAYRSSLAAKNVTIKGK